MDVAVEATPRGKSWGRVRGRVGRPSLVPHGGASTRRHGTSRPPRQPAWCRTCSHLASSSFFASASDSTETRVSAVQLRPRPPTYGRSPLRLSSGFPQARREPFAAPRRATFRGSRFWSSCSCPGGPRPPSSPSRHRSRSGDRSPRSCARPSPSRWSGAHPRARGSAPRCSESRAGLTAVGGRRAALSLQRLRLSGSSRSSSGRSERACGRRGCSGRRGRRSGRRSSVGLERADRPVLPRRRVPVAQGASRGTAAPGAQSTWKMPRGPTA